MILSMMDAFDKGAVIHVFWFGSQTKAIIVPHKYILVPKQGENFSPLLLRLFLSWCRQKVLSLLSTVAGWFWDCCPLGVLLFPALIIFKLCKTTYAWISFPFPFVIYLCVFHYQGKPIEDPCSSQICPPFIALKYFYWSKLVHQIRYIPCKYAFAVLCFV